MDLDRCAKLIRIVMDTEGNANEQETARKHLSKVKQEDPALYQQAMQMVLQEQAGTTTTNPGPPPSTAPGPALPAAWLQGLQQLVQAGARSNPVLQGLLGVTGVYTATFRNFVHETLPHGSWVPLPQVLQRFMQFHKANLPFLLAEVSKLVAAGELEVQQTPQGAFVRRQPASPPSQPA